MTSIHDSFNNVQANLEYNLSDIVVELKRTRDGAYTDSLVKIENVGRQLRDGTLMKFGESIDTHSPLVRIATYHNALLVAEGMQANGQKTIILNPKYSLPDQILAAANCLNCNLKASALGEEWGRGVFASPAEAVSALSVSAKKSLMLSPL